MLDGVTDQEEIINSGMATFQVIKSTNFLIIVEKFLRSSDG